MPALLVVTEAPALMSMSILLFVCAEMVTMERPVSMVRYHTFQHDITFFNNIASYMSTLISEKKHYLLSWQKLIELENDELI